MDAQEVLASLVALEKEVQGVDKIDAETKASLAEAITGVRRVLDPAEATTPDDAKHSQEGLRGALMEFEAEHPKLAEAIGRLADGLANLGI